MDGALINGFAQILDVLHEIDSTVGQVLCRLAMGEDAHKLQDDLVLACKNPSASLHSAKLVEMYLANMLPPRMGHRRHHKLRRYPRAIRLAHVYPAPSS